MSKSVYEFNLRNMIDEGGISNTAKRMHEYFAGLRDKGKGEIRHGHTRNVWAHKIKEYRKAWNNIFS